MRRKLIFSDEAWEDYLHWQATDRSMVRRINQLIKDIRRSPHEGIGKPEPLKHQLAGWWSRRNAACAPNPAIESAMNHDCLSVRFPRVLDTRRFEMAPLFLSLVDEDTACCFWG